MLFPVFCKTRMILWEVLKGERERGGFKSKKRKGKESDGLRRERSVGPRSSKTLVAVLWWCPQQDTRHYTGQLHGAPREELWASAFPILAKIFLSLQGFLGGAVVKNPSANTGDARAVGSIPGSGRSPGVGNGHPLQYFCLENPMDRGAWRATVHGVAKSQTRLSRHTLTHITRYGRTESLLLTRARHQLPTSESPFPILFSEHLVDSELFCITGTLPVFVHSPRTYEIFETWKKKVLAPKYENKVAKLIRTSKHSCAQLLSRSVMFNASWFHGL